MEATHRSFCAGLYDGPVLVASSVGSHCRQMDLTPSGAFRLLGLAELANGAAALEEELGRPARFALLDRWLQERLASAAASPADVA